MSFQESLSYGKQAEKAVQATLRGRDWTVTDVSDDVDYRKQDIDILVENSAGEGASIEIKADKLMNRTGNMVVELITNLEQGRLGWIEYCKADYIFYVDTVANVAYCFLLSDLKEYLKAHSRDVKIIHSKEAYKTRVLALVDRIKFFKFLDSNQKFKQRLKLKEVVKNEKLEA